MFFIGVNKQTIETPKFSREGVVVEIVRATKYQYVSHIKNEQLRIELSLTNNIYEAQRFSTREKAEQTMKNALISGHILDFGFITT